MKLCSAQIQTIKGDIESNIQKHISFINLAAENGAELIFFSELSLTGYVPTLAKTLATTPDDSRLDIFQVISDTKQIIICVGIPTHHYTGICISMVIFQPQTPRQTYSKQILHFDEYPYFINGDTQVFLSYKNHKIAPAICFESLQNEHSTEASASGASIYLASVAKSVKGLEKANSYYPKIAKKFNIIVMMSNSIGLADDFVCTGNSAAWNSKGHLVAQLDEKNEGIIIFDTETQQFTIQIM